MRYIVAVAGLAFSAIVAGKTLNEFLPGDQTYIDGLPQPSDYFGFSPGERHLRHDQLVGYMRTLAAASDRIHMHTIGRTHEGREQTLMAITHPQNVDRLDELRGDHLRYVAGESGKAGLLIVWLGYSIHGNEASGSNAAPLVAYYLAAAEEIEEKLKETIILIDPSLNPDGMGRFAHWANTNRSYQPVGDPQNREHNEYWPGGRFNHYWFDLNRDWLLLAHPESRNRVKVFQDWRPHVFGDWHEMGSSSTYFFQPGVPERQNPLTPQRNFDLTAKIAEYHAAALDARGELYFSKEQFDDYYYGKGSTYPDIQGSIGILFEQASARGHLMSTAQRELSFADAVHNQFSTSLSTIKGAWDLADQLKSYQRDFVRNGLERGRGAAFAGYVFGSADDAHRPAAFANVLRQHGLEVLALGERVEADGIVYRPGTSYFVAAAQPQFPLLEAMFETRTEFADSTFYDVSTWTLPMAFGLDFTEVRRAPATGETQTNAGILPDNAYAYLVDWRHYLAPRVLAALHKEKIPVRVATKPFAMEGSNYPRGTLIVASGLVSNKDKLLATLNDAAQSGVPVTAVQTGLSTAGPDLGSPTAEPLKAPRVAMVTGPGVSPPEAGEVWQVLDERMQSPPAMLDTINLPFVDLSRYSHLLMVNGDYAGLAPAQVDQIRNWILGGGILVASKKAATWATQNQLHKPPEPEADDPNATPPMEPRPVRAYGQYEDDYSQTVIGGAIVRADADVTHPLLYGYSGSELLLFRNGTDFFERSDNPYATPLRYTSDPLVSGFLGAERENQLAGSAAAIAERVGNGMVIRFADNLNFRGYWYGTNKVYLNAIYLSQIIGNTQLPDTNKRMQ